MLFGRKADIGEDGANVNRFAEIRAKIFPERLH
jgi:hypothetical protein